MEVDDFVETSDVEELQELEDESRRALSSSRQRQDSFSPRKRVKVRLVVPCSSMSFLTNLHLFQAVSWISEWWNSTATYAFYYTEDYITYMASLLFDVATFRPGWKFPEPYITSAPVLLSNTLVIVIPYITGCLYFVDQENITFELWWARSNNCHYQSFNYSHQFPAHTSASFLFTWASFAT